MKKNNYDDRGTYDVSSFCFFIRTTDLLFDKDGNFNHNLNDRDKGTFVHEYIHYIQNISTAYGFLEIIDKYQRLKNVVTYITENDKIRRPIVLDTKNTKNSITHRLDKFMDNKTKNPVFDQISYDYVLTSDTETKTEKKVLQVTFLKDGQIGQKIKFGMLGIKESMAFLVQRLIDKEIEKEQLVYNIVELVVKDIYPEIIDENRLNLIVLCYYSLSLPYSESGKFLFYEVLIYLKNNNLTFNDPLDLYRHLYYEFSFDSISNINQIEPNREYTLHSFFEEKCKDAYASIIDLLNGNFEESKFLCSILSNALYYYKQSPCDIVKLIISIQNSESIDELIDRYGRPYIYAFDYNGFDYEDSQHLPDKGFVRISVMGAIEQILFSKKDEPCSKPLMRFCQITDKKASDDSEKIRYDREICPCKPWRRIEQGYPICPFTKIWIDLGLIDKFES